MDCLRNDHANGKIHTIGIGMHMQRGTYGSIGRDIHIGYCRMVRHFTTTS